MKHLIIVAHPDDETIFFGDFLRQNPATTKVICVTRETAGNSDIRRKKFEKAMEFFGCRHFEMWPYPDRGIRYEIPDFQLLEGNGKRKIPFPFLKESLKKAITEHDYEKIITHNEKGEYGHPHHKQIHRMVREICHKPFYVFERGDMISDEGCRFKEQAARIYVSDPKWLFFFVSCIGIYESLKRMDPSC